MDSSDDDDDNDFDFNEYDTDLICLIKYDPKAQIIECGP